MNRDERGGTPSPALALERRIPSLVAAWRAGSGLSPLSKAEIASTGAALLALQRGLTGERGLAGARYMDEGGFLGAYLLYYWPVSYLETALSLAELGLSPRRVLDLGSGPGPAAAAALDASGGRADLVLADGSRAALDVAQRVLEAGPRAGDASEAGSSAYRELDLEDGAEALGKALGVEAPFDLVILGHCVNELWREAPDRAERRLALLEAAADLLAPGGALLVLEPALLATSREALALRDALASRGHTVLGPCPRAAAGPYPCPALAAGPDRTCHSEAPWEPPEPVASLARAAGLDRRSVKWTWFAVGAPKGADGENDASCDTARGETTSRNALIGRVVSDPMLNKAGRVRYVLCAGGRLATLSAPRDSGIARGSGFLALARGDLVGVEGAEERAGGLGLREDSTLRILARAPAIGGAR